MEVAQRASQQDHPTIATVVSSTISGLVGGLTSALMSVFLAAYCLPMPIDTTHHIVGYGIGGFMCGALSGFMGVFMYVRRARRLERVGAASKACAQ